jgi:hypothetical protein
MRTPLFWKRDAMGQPGNRVIVRGLRILGIIMAGLMFVFLCYVAQLFLHPGSTSHR